MVCQVCQILQWDLIFYHKPVQATIELDACLTGFGGRWGSWVYHVPIQKRYKNLAITQLETLNILVALRIFCPLLAQKKGTC